MATKTFTNNSKSRAARSTVATRRWKPRRQTKAAVSKPNEAPDWNTTGKPGSLTTAMLNIIRRDARQRRVGSSPWKKAPTPEEATRNAKAAAKRLAHRNFSKIAGTESLASIIAGCGDKAPCGSHACFRCGQMDQRWVVSAMAPVLSSSDHGYKDWAFNFVMPEGQTAIKGLADARFNLLIGRIRKALLTSPKVRFAVFAVDVSANDDTEKFLKGRLLHGRKRYFQAHVYGVVRAKKRAVVWRALRGLFGTAPNIYRPLWISKEPFDGSAKGVSYILKPQGFRHVAYLNLSGHWKTRKPTPRLKPREHVHYLLAMDQLGFSRRIGFVGLHPVVTDGAGARPATVVLRRVRRGER